MEWNLGWQGVGTLALMSLVCGVITQLLFWGRSMWWVWIVATAAFFLGGVLISEVWFGWATEADLQPNIDGLSFDEVLLGYVVGLAVIVAARYLATRRSHRPAH
jgi:uncharacterized membrane protein YhaH (DUF805 family)